MTWEDAGYDERGWEWCGLGAGMEGVGVDSRLRGNDVGGCTRRTVAAFLGEFLVRARAGVNKRNARTHEFSPHLAAFCRIDDC